MEDIQVPTSIPEYSQDAPFEKPQLQFIDIIDPIANAVEIFPYENADPNPDSSFTHGNQGANHWIENTAHEMSGEEKEDQGKQEEIKEKKEYIPYQQTRDWQKESGEGLCEVMECHPVSTRAYEVTKQEERSTQQALHNKAYGTHRAKESQEEAVQLQEPMDQMVEETQLEINETAPEEDSDGADAEEVVQNENKEDFLYLLPTSHSSNSQIEKSNEEPGSVKKNDISRHSYSRYNTISYRKIRKGNTKQRIDEFESMMHS